jgi:hypothetical protein
MKRLSFTVFQFLIVVSIISYAQNKHLTIGHENIGICFGNSKTNSVLRFSIRDKNVNEINGVAISAINRTRYLHGIQFGLWNVADNNKIFKKMPLLNFNLEKR